MTRIKGSCLCGAVQITAKPANKKVGACHCVMCRKWGGGPFMEINCGTEVLFNDQECITVYNSSDWAERGFCKMCGSHLFYRLKHSGEHQIPVGLFDGALDPDFDLQVFIDEKPSFYSFAEETRMMTAAEIYEKFAPPPK